MMKLLSCRYNMDTNRVEARFEDGTVLSLDCIAIEDEYGNTPAQRAELDWLLYNKPLEYAQLVLSGEIEHYLSLGCDHGRLEDNSYLFLRFTFILHRNHLHANFYAFTFHRNFCLVILIAADRLHPVSTPKDVRKASCLHI